MRTIIALTAIMLVGAGCESTKPLVTPMEVTEPTVLLELPAPGETKKVMFMVGVGQTGGLGSMPVVTETGAPFFMNGLSVYADAFAKEIEKRLPECYVGQPRIVINATISLEERRGVNESIPGEVDEESYYKIIIKDVHTVTVEAEPCKE